jgi:hypothetical protein
MKDYMGKEWEREENALDRFCKTHLISLTIEYLERPGRIGGNTTGKVYVHQRASFKKTGEEIFEVNSNHPMSDEEILLKLKQYTRTKKLNKLL